MLIPAQPVIKNKIINKIYLLRDLKVMLDFDLAEMYMVETKQLKRGTKKYGSVPGRFYVWIE